MNKILQDLHRLGSPAFFYAWTEKILPFIWGTALALIILGLVGGLYWAPPDHLQGDGFRIIYVHVPCAVLSLGFYLLLAMASLVFLIWHPKMAFILGYALAPVGLALTALALITGSIWGKPMWGTWWIWDARLTSELILFFLYAGYCALEEALKEYPQRHSICALLAVVGSLDIPIIHYSVEWWNTLHQGATISKFAKPSIEWSMAWPLMLMIGGIALVALGITITKMRSTLLLSHVQTKWVLALGYGRN